MALHTVHAVPQVFPTQAMSVPLPVAPPVVPFTLPPLPPLPPAPLPLDP